MSSLKEIEERQQQLYRLIDQMNSEEDMTRMLQTVQLIEQGAKELETAALAFQAKMDQQFGKRPQGAFEVVLTADQRARILKATGVPMTSVLVDDTTGVANAAMPTSRPEQIEAIALRQAQQRKLEEEAEIEARAQVERTLRELEMQNQLVADQVARLREDPTFRKQMGLEPKK